MACLARAVVAVLVCGVGLSAAGCGPKSTPEALGPGRHHTRPGENAAAPADDIADAKHDFSRAVGGTDPQAVVAAALALAQLGGLDDADDAVRQDVGAAIDAVGAKTLTESFGAAARLDEASWLAAAICERLGRISIHRRQDVATIASHCPARSADPAKASPGVAAMVAVLLPLSGPHGALGRELRDGIRDAMRRERGVEVRYFDTVGDADKAAAAVRTAAAAGAAIVLGPVGESESGAAAVAALEAEVPIALLTPTSGGGSRRDGLFRLWSSPTMEAEESARLAAEMGYDRVAVFAPRDVVGQAQASAFAAAAKAHGISVVADGRYDPTATDLEPDVKRLLGLDPKTNERLRAHLRANGKKGWQTFSPDVEFALLYIPDVYHRAALVAAYLPYFNVELRTTDMTDVVALRKKHRGRVPQVVQLLGSSGWHHPGLMTRGGSAVEGALVVDFFAGSASEDYATAGAAEFADGFVAQHGRQPSAVAAQAYDAARLVAAAARKVTGASTGRGARAKVVEQIARGVLEDGACGEARMGANAELMREAILLRVEEGAFVIHAY